MDADLVSQTLKICNLTTIEAILMKRSSIIYLCQIFHLANTKSDNANIKIFFAYFYTFSDEVKKQ